ncbi:MAG: cysteine hydrolase [Nitrospirae bacterium]|jgi:ureidoacrylate peracid hydrolase|nr:cysteine hydrolase [Nitrospirota bacterium]
MKRTSFLVAILIAIFVSVPFMVQAAINLGGSGAAAPGPMVKYEPIPEGPIGLLNGGKHYQINPKKTALFIIDPQKVYSDPASPLYCEKYQTALANIEKLARAAHDKGIKVFLIKHVYYSDGNGGYTNCGRLCDFGVQALWGDDNPWSELDVTPGILKLANFYAEKSIYSSFTIPVASMLRILKIDTVIITGYMTEFCSVTATRHGHDLGFKMIYVKDANDGPALLESLGGIDENAAIPFWLSIPVADVYETTDDLINALQQ